MIRNTNDLGQYRFYWVTPGRYVVAAEGPLGGVLQADPVSAFEQGVSRGNNELRENYPRQFYPGFPEEEKAAAIELSPGAEIRAIDLTLTAAKGFFVRGRVIDALTGQPLPKVSVSGLGGSRYIQNSEGTFEFFNVLRGTYTLTATIGGDAISALLNQNSTQPRGAATVIVADADVENVVLAVAAPRVVRGNIRVEGALVAPSQVGRSRFNLVPESRPPGSSGIIGVPTNADGTFSFGSIVDGMFRISMPNLPAGLYLKEARLDGVDMLNGFARIGSAEKLELLISSNAGTVEGMVTDDLGNPRSGIQTVLVPKQRHRTDLFKRVLSDPNGRFTISGIAPGEYKAFAWAGLEEYEYFDPAVLAAYESMGRVIQIAESSRQTVSLRVIEGQQP